MLTKGKTVWKGGSPNRIQGNYILFSQFFCKSITALKSKVYLKKCFFFAGKKLHNFERSIQTEFKNTFIKNI